MPILRISFLVGTCPLDHHQPMDQTSYTYLAIALLPFLLWATILFAISSSQQETQQPPSSQSGPDDTASEFYSDNFVIIPYGLVLPLYYRSRAQTKQFG